MKNALIAFLFPAVFLVAACSECYRCHNLCQQCYEQHHDTTLTITVCSDVFGEDQYHEYLDSLTSPSLGWTCTDANSTSQVQFCGNSTNNNVELLNRKSQGWICAPEN